MRSDSPEEGSRPIGGVMSELIELWRRTIGEPPTLRQFEVWGALHTDDIIRRGILKTATKNLSLSVPMSPNHLIRFASKVMTTATDQIAANARNREALNQEMEGQ